MGMLKLWGDFREYKSRVDDMQTEITRIRDFIERWMTDE